MKNADEPAFPTEEWSSMGQQVGMKPGLTKREYFAAMAMQGILSNQNWVFSQAYAAPAAIQEADRLLEQLES